MLLELGLLSEERQRHEAGAGTDREGHETWFGAGRLFAFVVGLQWDSKTLFPARARTLAKSRSSEIFHTSAFWFVLLAV